MLSRSSLIGNLKIFDHDSQSNQTKWIAFKVKRNSKVPIKEEKVWLVDELNIVFKEESGDDINSTTSFITS